MLNCNTSSLFGFCMMRTLSCHVGFCMMRTLSSRRSLSYRNQSIDLPCKSMDWFLYDRDLCYERVKCVNPFMTNVLMLYPLKPPGNLWFFGVFRGYEMGKLARNGLILNDFTMLLWCFILILNIIFLFEFTNRKQNSKSQL